jgi:hypothetical protein
VSLSPSPSRSYAHEGNGTNHSHQYSTLIPHPLASNTATSGHGADLQAWSNLADLHIENVPPLYSALGGPPTFHPLLLTQLWNSGNTSSCSQQEMVHYPVAVPKKGHYGPTQTQSIRPGHWDLPIDSNLNTVSIVITACLRCSFANSNVKDWLANAPTCRGRSISSVPEQHSVLGESVPGTIWMPPCNFRRLHSRGPPTSFESGYLSPASLPAAIQNPQLQQAWERTCCQVRTGCCQATAEMRTPPREFLRSRLDRCGVQARSDQRSAPSSS